MRTTRNMIDRLRTISSEADSLADSMESSSSDSLAIDVLRGMIPAARLHAAKTLHGDWWAYLVMPDKWRPDETHGWMYNEQQDHYWDDFHGDTKAEALKKALNRLIELART